VELFSGSVQRIGTLQSATQLCDTRTINNSSVDRLIYLQQ